MDPICICSMLAVDIVQGNTIIEDFLFLVTEVAEAVPLARRLRIECPDIIVDDARWFLIDVLVKELTAEERGLLSV